MKSRFGSITFAIIFWATGFVGGAAQKPTGNSASASDRTSHLQTTSSNGGTFINPKAGQVVHPGETIHIDAKLDSGIAPVKALAINSRLGFSNELREQPPYSFTFKVPDKDRDVNGQLIGLQQLWLFGAIVGRKDYELAMTTVDVEESDLPLSLFIVGPFVYQANNRPAKVNFLEVGQEQIISVYAKFPNGHELDVSGSTYLSVSSENPKVASVRAADHRIYIASKGGGQTRLAATYSLGGQRKLLYAPVIVRSESQEIEISPDIWDFGDVHSNGANSSRQVTITNRSPTDLRIYKIESPGFAISNDNCSNRVLAPSASCTLAVTFRPTAPGPIQGTLSVPHSHSTATMPLLGNGI